MSGSLKGKNGYYKRKHRLEKLGLRVRRWKNTRQKRWLYSEALKENENKE